MRRWSEITQTESYQNLDTQSKAKAAQQYFTQYVAPELQTPEQRTKGLDQWMRTKGPDSESRLEAYPKILEQGAKAAGGVSESVPEMLLQYPDILADTLQTNIESRRKRDTFLDVYNDPNATTYEQAGGYLGAGVEALKEHVRNLSTFAGMPFMSAGYGAVQEAGFDREDIPELQAARQKRAEQVAAMAPYVNPGDTLRGLEYEALPSVVEQAGPLALSVATRNPAPAYGGIVAQSLPRQYLGYTDAGLSPSEAMAYGTAATGAEFAAERLPLSVWLARGKEPTQQALKDMLGERVGGVAGKLAGTVPGRVATGAIAEGLSGGVTSMAQQGLEYDAGLTPDITLDDYATNVARDAAMEMIGGTALGIPIEAYQSYQTRNETKKEVPQQPQPVSESSSIPLLDEQNNAIDPSQIFDDTAPSPDNELNIPSAYRPSPEAVEAVLDSDAPVQDIVDKDKLLQQGFIEIDRVDNDDAEVVSGKKALFNPETGQVISLDGQTALDNQTMQPLDAAAIQKVKQTGRIPAQNAEGLQLQTALVEAEAQAATSAINDKPEPTVKQKEAGNYAKGHLKVAPGLDVSIENPKGSIRKGENVNGQSWEVNMPAAYGYIRRTQGADGEQLDVYIGDNLTSDKVFVIDQNDADTGIFDEQKVMYGFSTIRDALETYENGFSDGKGRQRIGNVKEMSVSEFRKWLATEEYKKSYTRQQALEKAKQVQSRINQGRDVGQLAKEEQAAALDLVQSGYFDRQQQNNVISDVPFVQEERGNLDVPAPSRAKSIAETSSTAAPRSYSNYVVITRADKAGNVTAYEVMAGYGNERKALEDSQLGIGKPNAIATMNQEEFARWENQKRVSGNRVPVIVNEPKQDRPAPALATTEASQNTPEIIFEPDVAQTQDTALSDAETEETKIQESIENEETTNQLTDVGDTNVVDILQTEKPLNPVEMDYSTEKPVQRQEQPAATQPDQQTDPSSEDTSNPYEGLKLPDLRKADLKQLYNARKKVEKAFVEDSSGDSPLSDEQFDLLERYSVDLESAIEQRQKSGETPFDKKKKATESKPNQENAEILVKDAERKAGNVIDEIANRIKADEDLSVITKARKIIEQYEDSKIDKDGPSAKRADELIETAYTKVAREIAADPNATPEQIYQRLVALYQKQPNLSTRSSTSKRMQAYSTPAPLAYLASRLADIKGGKSVYEPTVGHGSLLIEADPANQNIYANELDSGRSQRFREIFPDPANGNSVAIYTQDAMSIPDNPQVNRVIANPPFGKVFDHEKDKVKRFRVQGLETSDIDQAILLKSLQKMKDDGKAVFIIGSKTGGKSSQPEKWIDAYNTANARAFFKKLYDNYNVTDHFIVDGKLYARQGAAFNLDVIVINGKGKSKLDLPGYKLPAYYARWEDLQQKLNGATYNEESILSKGSSVPDAISNLQTTNTADRQGNVSDIPARTAFNDTESDIPANKGRNVTIPTGERTDAVNQQRTSDVTGGTDNSRQFSDGGQDTVRDTQPDKTRNDDRKESTGRSGTQQAGRIASGNISGRTDAKITKTNKFQSSYKPVSKSEAIGTLLPANLAESYTAAVRDLENSIGESIDEYVTRKLQYDSEDKMRKLFAAEQVESIASAINNLERGKGFIIADQTGIGKGRQVAALLRYARVSGKTPVFVTKQPELFADMYRDLMDIGEDPNAFVTDGNLRNEQEIKYPEGNKVIRALTKKPLNDAFDYMIKTGKMPEGFDYIFTTYPQNQPTGTKDVPKRQIALDAVMPNAIIVFDESHEAAGGEGGWKRKTEEGKEQYASRAALARHFAQKAAGAVFSSATYAKNPKGFTLYAPKTDMADAVEDVQKLPDIIERGGVPLMQAMSSALTRAGQLARRERDYEGISMGMKVVSANQKDAEAIAELMNRVWQFDTKMQTRFNEMDKELSQAAERMGKDNAVGDTGLSSTSFSSIMHNVVSQSLVALKAKQAVTEAIAAHKRGEKILIAVDKTNESILKSYAEGNNIALNGDLGNTSIKAVFEKYLERTREYNVEVAGEKTKQKRYIDNDQLKRMGLYDEYQKTSKFIRDLDIDDLPISPIDYIRNALEEAGIKTGELTGREVRVDYSSGKQVYRKTENGKSQRSKAMRDFNAGKLDAIVLNRSGSTGFSLHASEKFKDQKPRHMFILEASPNIDVFMQTLGRTHRTGQVKLPIYSLLVSNLPAEKRPAANLMRKLAALNANTTAAKDSAISLDQVVDFMNKYGDEVVTEILAEDTELFFKLGMDTVSKDNDAGMAAIATGRAVLLPVKEQEAFYERIEKLYIKKINYLNSIGENELEAKELDIKAEFEKEVIIRDGKDSDSPFEQPTRLHQIRARVLGKPYKWEEIQEFIANQLGGKTPQQYNQELLDNYKQVTKAKYNEYLSNLKKAESTKDRKDTYTPLMQGVESFLKNFPIASRVVIKTPTENISGVIMEIRRDSKATSPAALSQFDVRIAIADARKELMIPLSQLIDPLETGKARNELHKDPFSEEKYKYEFDLGQNEARETRYVVTGNILAGFEQFGNAGGRVTFFTDKEGNTHTGLLMPKSFKPEESLSNTLATADSATEAKKLIDAAFKENPSLPAVQLNSKDGHLTFRLERGSNRFELIANTARGQQYYLNKKLTNIVGDFTGGRGKPDMVVKDIPSDKLDAVLEWMIANGGIVTRRHADTLRELRGQQRLAGAFQRRTDTITTPKQKASTAFDNLAYYDTKKKWTGAEIDLAEKVREEWARLFGNADTVGFVESLTDANGSPAYGYVGEGRIHEGDPLTTMALIALSKGDALGTAYHEGIHYLRRTGAFSRDTWEVLKRKAQSAWVDKYNIRKLYKADAETLADDAGLEGKERNRFIDDYLAEEAIAEALRERLSGKEVLSNNAFNKLVTFFERFRNMLAGRGFKSASDIFEGIAKGQYAVTGRAIDNGAGRFAKAQKQRSPLRYDESGLIDILREIDGDFFQKIQNIKSSDAISNMWTNQKKYWIDRFAPWQRQMDRMDAQYGKQNVSEIDDLNLIRRQEVYATRMKNSLVELNTKYKDPLMELIAGIDGANWKERLQTFSDYIESIHAPERNAQIAKINPDPNKGSGLSDKEAAEMKKRIEGRSDFATIKKAQQLYRKMMDDSLEVRFKSGLINEKTYQHLKQVYPNYVPLRGNEGIDFLSESDYGDTGQGYDLRSQEIKRAFGRETRASDILEHSFAIASEARIRAEKNRVGRTLLNLARTFPDDGFWKVNQIDLVPVLNDQTGMVEYRPKQHWRTYIGQQDSVVVKEDGKAYAITMNDKRLAIPLKNLDVHTMMSVFRLWGNVMRVYGRTLTSFSPEFMVSNLFRDIQTGIIASLDTKKLSRRVWKDYRKAFWGTQGGVRGKTDTDWQKWHKEMMEAGGGSIGVKGLQSINESKRNIRSELSRRDKGSIPAARRAAYAVFRQIELTNEGVENALRLSVYKNMRELGYSKDQAAFYAKNITTNYDRRGQFGREINTAYIFFNAGIQGTVTVVRKLRNPRVQKGVMGLVAAGVLLDMLNALLSEEDEDGRLIYDKIPEWEKESNWIFMDPDNIVGEFFSELGVDFGKSQIDNVNYIKIPAPYGWRMFSNIGRIGSSYGRGQINASGMAANVYDSFMINLNPVTGADGIQAPTLFQPLWDIDVNKDWRDSPIRPPVYNEKGYQAPASEQYFDGTPQWAIDMARFLNKATGGDSVQEGIISVSPADMNYLLEQYTGSVGAFINRSVAYAQAIQKGDDIGTNQVPIVRRLAGGTSLWQDRQIAREWAYHVEKAEDIAKAYLKKGDMEGFKQYKSENMDLLSMSNLAVAKGRKGAAASILQFMQDIRKQKTFIRNNDKLTDAQKKAQLKRLDLVEKKKIDAFNRLYAKKMNLDAESTGF